MLHGEGLGLLVGAVALGTVHGIEPGHGWPVAATYALDQANKWMYGFAASVILGIGHLVSSIAMVAAFFYAKSYFDLAQVDEPIHLTETVVLGGPVSLVAGLLLVALGVREYRHGHSHDHAEPDHDARADHHPRHEHGDSHHPDDHHPRHEHDGRVPGHNHDEGENSFWNRLTGALPLVGSYTRGSGEPTDAAERGLWGIAWFAFLLGFAHEEEFEIIAMCSGSSYCLELMTAYALAVIVGIVGLTLLLVAGYEHFEDRVERYTPYLPAVSATVLVVMGLGFIFGVF